MLRRKGNRGITLIALVITIIVLLILAGVAINSIMGQDSAPQKAADARMENDKGAARDAATIKAAEYVQKYYDEKHVQGNEELIGMTAGEYVAQEMNNQTEGAYKFIVDGMTLKVFSADANVSTDEPIVEGTINDDGTITWSDTTTGGAGNGTWTGSVTTEEETALAANGMSKLADSDVPSNLKTDSIKAVLSGNVPIPVGYTYVEGTSTALESTPTSWGVVIEDEDHNEWVWVPVADASEMYDTIEPTQIGVKKEEKEIKVAEEKKAPEITYAGKLEGVKLASVDGLWGINFGLKVADSSSEEEETSYSIEIKCYKDGNYDTSDYITKKEGEQITESDIDTNKYENYHYVGTDPNVPITGYDGMTINVYYEEDEKINYTVEYYKDDTLVDTETESIYTQEQTVQVEETDIDKTYSGYQIERTDPELPTNVRDGDTIKIYYKKTNAQIARETTVEKKSKSEIISGINRGSPNNRKSYREPALTVFDYYEEYYTQAGFTSAKQMADAFVKDYNDMIASIEKYGGFYVGRYELSGSVENSTVKTNQTQLNASWYKLYKAERQFATNATTSTMMWGCQWDIMCKWAQESGDKVSYSTKKSTHSNNENTKTGQTLGDKRNNIYDVEGSRPEITQEACWHYGRATRGGDYTNTGGNQRAMYRNSKPANESRYPDEYNYSRPTLYIK